MAYPVANSYSVGSGLSIYGGRAAASSGLPTWVEALPLWQHYGIPNTALASVEPAPFSWGIQGPSAKISSWNGATLRRVGSIYLVTAPGGHGDYFGNENDGVGLNTETPGWVEYRAHSDVSVIYNQVSVYGDGRKAATHTYWATQYDQVNDRVLILNAGGLNTVGAPAAPAGYPYPVGNPPISMAFDMGPAKDWMPVATMPLMPWSTQSADMFCAHPTTSDIYFNGSSHGYLYKYSPTTNAWSTVGPWYLNGAYCASAIDPVRNRMLAVGDFNGIRPPEIRSLVDASQVAATFGGLGPGALTVSGYPGLVYDEANDCFLMAINGAANIDILRIDAATLFVDRPPITNSIANRPNGIHNSFQYVPELRGVVIANSYTGNLQFMRTHL